MAREPIKPSSAESPPVQEGAPLFDDRLRREPDEGRQDRAMQDRTHTENRVVSDDDRLELFKNSFTQAALPDLPREEGWHNCWLSTTNPKDPIHFRQRIGYELIKGSDLPGYEVMMVKNPNAEFAGYVMVGEMIAARIPMSLYARYMKEVHHTAPMEEEGRLRSALDTIRNAAQGRGGDLLEGDGMRDLGKTPPQQSPFGTPSIRNPDQDSIFS